ncbi:MAG TPA: hypothetical protein VIU63_01715, partial [Nitrospira sp.]
PMVMITAIYRALSGPECCMVQYPKFTNHVDWCRIEAFPYRVREVETGGVLTADALLGTILDVKK